MTERPFAGLAVGYSFALHRTFMAQAHTDITPRAAAFIAALHGTKGDPEAAGVWVLELISWLVFHRRPFLEAPPPQEREQTSVSLSR